MKRGAFAIAFVVAQVTATFALAQEPLNLPPPPPPTSPQQYTPPPMPPPTPQPAPQTQPAPRREPPPPRREHEHEREREREREPPPPPQRPRYVPPPPPRDEPPPARRGFQMAFRTGVSFPIGSISGADNDAMSRDFGAQVPLFVELGVKLHPMIFLGGYTALSLGAASSDFKTAQGCGQGGRSCLTSALRVGVEVQVHFQPDERIDPWAGYGIGLEAASASASGGGTPEASESFTGIELARLAGGVDFRFTPLFGIGPYAELAFGTYSHAHVEGYAGQAQKTGDSDIANTALHVWPTIGVRGVFFP
jgi:hypothetical protein